MKSALKQGVPAKADADIVRTVWRTGGLQVDSDIVATETAVALVYNGISHVVMMATPTHLEDMAMGFSLTEGIVSGPGDIREVEFLEKPKGIEISITIASEAFFRLKERRRNLTGRTGCGLCGAESLEQAILPPNQVDYDNLVSHESIQKMIYSIGDTQLLQHSTGAVHGAAWFDNEGNLELLREDIGRHNALDKLLGAHTKAELNNRGVLVITSRASYEMVVKASWAHMGIVVALSGPTSLAIELAQQAGITLIGFGRYGSHAVYSHPQRLI